MFKKWNVVIAVYAGVCAFCTGYYVDRALQKKTDELIDDGGVLNALIIGGGKGAISSTVGLAVGHLIMKTMTRS